jgi:hypothetical protein
LPATLFAVRSVEICPTVQAKLCQLAFDAFTSRPGEGETIGGVLLGEAGREGVEVTDFWQGDDARENVVGYWSVRRRVSQTWERASGEGVYLVVSPVTVQRAEALIWQREADGAESEARAMTIRIERRVASRAGRSSDAKPAAAVAAASPARSWSWLGLGAACLALVGLTAWMIPVATEAPQPRVALSLKSVGNALQVQWRENTPGDTGTLQSAALVVRQGQKEEILDLMDNYGPEGQIEVPLQAQEVVISLRVRRAGQAVTTRTVTYVNPGPGHAMRNGVDTEWLRWRNRELEERVAALQARF